MAQQDKRPSWARVLRVLIPLGCIVVFVVLLTVVLMIAEPEFFSKRAGWPPNDLATPPVAEKSTGVERPPPL